VLNVGSRPRQVELQRSGAAIVGKHDNVQQFTPAPDLRLLSGASRGFVQLP
jgi:hypothetical protein